jgi:hypothetical protein
VTDASLLTLDGHGQRAESFRFDLLDQHNSSLGKLDVIEDEAPQVANNINSTVKRTLTGLLLPPSVTKDINTLSDRVQMWMVLEDGTEYSQGVFLFADASRAEAFYASTDFVLGEGETPGADSALGQFTTGTLSDQLMTLDQGSRGINFYAAGASIYDALVQQMEAGNVEQYAIEATDAVIAQPIVWKPNTKRLAVINDLCRMAGFYSLFFDNNGVGQLRSVPPLEAVDATVEYTPGTNVIAGSVVETDDLLKAPNSYVVVNSSFTQSPIWGEWLVPASAPHSYANRLFYVVAEYDQPGAESNASARKMAKAIGQADYATYRWVNLDSAINPIHDTFTIAAWKGDKYREQQWSYTARAGENMHHEFRRVWSDDVADELIEQEQGQGA